MMHAAIPTTVDGIRFRSRLEARWYLYFKSMGWRPEYEPIDFDGWIPDFRLSAAAAPLFVEVKPILWPSDIACEKRRGFAEAVRLEKGWSDCDVLVVGTGPVVRDYCIQVGMIWYHRREGAPYYWRVASLGRNYGLLDGEDVEADQYGLIEGDLGWDVINEFHGNYVYLQGIDTTWNEAGNAVQYKAPR